MSIKHNFITINLRKGDLIHRRTIKKEKTSDYMLVVGVEWESKNVVGVKVLDQGQLNDLVLDKYLFTQRWAIIRDGVKVF